MGTRAKKPAGFSLWECWGEALDLDPKSPAGQAAAHMYKHVFDGVRLMIKFQEFYNKGPMRKQIDDRVRRAREYDLKVLLVIDWFNVATGPKDYHKSIHIPVAKDLPRLVSQIITYYKPDMVEVCNEPNYHKGHKTNAKEYSDRVSLFVEGAARAGFKGPMLCTGTRKDLGWSVKDGWEWHATRHPGGMLEGKHSLVLHELETPEQVRDGLIGDIPNGKAVGYQWPLFESEFSGVGRRWDTDSVHGAQMTMAGYQACKDKSMPLCYLTMGGWNNDFDDTTTGPWRMRTGLIDVKGRLSTSALALCKAEGAPKFELEGDDPPSPPVPPVDDGDGEPDPGGEGDGGGKDGGDGGDAEGWRNEINRALDLLDRVITLSEENPEILLILLRIIEKGGLKLTDLLKHLPLRG